MFRCDVKETRQIELLFINAYLVQIKSKVVFNSHLGLIKPGELFLKSKTGQECIAYLESIQNTEIENKKAQSRERYTKFGVSFTAACALV